MTTLGDTGFIINGAEPSFGECFNMLPESTSTDKAYNVKLSPSGTVQTTHCAYECNTLGEERLADSVSSSTSQPSGNCSPCVPRGTMPVAYSPLSGNQRSVSGKSGYNFPQNGAGLPGMSCAIKAYQDSAYQSESNARFHNGIESEENFLQRQKSDFSRLNGTHAQSYCAQGQDPYSSVYPNTLYGKSNNADFYQTDEASQQDIYANTSYLNPHVQGFGHRSMHPTPHMFPGGSGHYMQYPGEQKEVEVADEMGSDFPWMREKKMGKKSSENRSKYFTVFFNFNKLFNVKNVYCPTFHNPLKRDQIF